MKPTRNNILIKIQLDQKETIKHGTLTLYAPFRQQYNPNAREGNPVLAEVIAENKDYPELKKGDMLVLDHATVENKARYIISDATTATMSIEVDRWIFGKLDDSGALQPLFGNLVAKRISEVPASSIIITPDAYKKTDDHRMIVLSAAPGVKILPGQTVLCFKCSDYECVFYVNNEERRVIVIFEEDAVSILKEVA